MQPRGGAIDAVARGGLIVGAVVFVAMLLMAPPSTLSVPAWRTAAVAVLMATWWITEAIPISATALVPLALFPVLGIVPMNKAAAPYANPTIFLFLGGFILAAGLEQSGLHRRIALNVIRAVGTRPANLVGGFMIATAALSMWVSNTATVLMMLPIATSVIAVLKERDDARRAFMPMLLGIAWAASIGGLGTLIGTPPNALLSGFAVETLHRRIGFVQWMGVGVPLVIVSIPAAWILLTRVVFRVSSAPAPEGDDVLVREAASLGRMTRAEWIVTLVGIATALAWIFEPLLERTFPAVSDAGIAMTGGLLLFVIPLQWKPRTSVISWNDVEHLPWGVLILFGGGLSLAAAIDSTGLAGWTGSVLSGLGDVSPLVLTTVLTTIVIFLTELTSNTATAATFLPVVSSLAVAFGMDPLLLAIPVTLAASCAFMLPVGTPPNTLVYATGWMTIPQMARAGFWMNIVMIVLIEIATFALAVPIFGIPW